MGDGELPPWRAPTRGRPTTAPRERLRPQAELVASRPTSASPPSRRRRRDPGAELAMPTWSSSTGAFSDRSNATSTPSSGPARSEGDRRRPTIYGDLTAQGGQGQGAPTSRLEGCNTKPPAASARCSFRTRPSSLFRIVFNIRTMRGGANGRSRPARTTAAARWPMFLTSPRTTGRLGPPCMSATDPGGSDQDRSPPFNVESLKYGFLAHPLSTLGGLRVAERPSIVRRRRVDRV